MAGDWIKMRSNLWDHPKVAKIVDMTDSSEAAVVGALYWLWATADQHTEDGILHGLTCKSIDRKTGVKGFAKALCDIGWIADHPEGVRIVDFEEHNGSSAKKRCQTAKRVANFAAANAGKSNESDGTNADSVSSALAREREEKSINTPIPPAGAELAPIPEKQKTQAIALPTWLEVIKASAEKPIPENDPVFSYAEQVGIPPDHLRLCWREFRDRYSQPGAKRYRDWRGVFRKAVRGNWFKLWWIDDAGDYALTTVGKQAEMAARQ